MNTKIIIKIGDITKENVDAIINSANSSMIRGSGVCGAIFKEAGYELEKECSKYSILHKGEVILTNAYNLPCKKIIHTLAPKYYLEENDRIEKLSSCYTNSLRLADENKFETITFPCIGMGIYKWPEDLGSDIAISSILSYLDNHPNTSLKIINIICFDEKLEKIFNKTLEKLKR